MNPADRRRFPTAWLLPTLVLVALVWAAPVVFAAVLAFSDATVGQAGRHIGMANFQRLLSDANFANSLFTSAVYATGATILSVGCGFFIALSLKNAPPYRRLVQTALLGPWVLAELAVALIWVGLLGESGGLINVFFGTNGGAAFPLQTNATAAMTALWLAALWRGLAFSTMFQMSGLTSLSQNLIRAARLDGARWHQWLFSILWPHQSRTIAVNGLIVLLLSLTSFTLPFALTAGGPLRATELIALYSYRTAFTAPFELGYAAAQGMVVTIGFAFLTAILMKLRRRLQ